MKKLIIISVNSDIGKNLAEYFLNKNYSILGTYRSKKTNLNTIKQVKLDLSNEVSIQKFCFYIKRNFKDWNHIIFCNGDLKPIEKITSVNLKLWERSIMVNCLSVTRILNYLLKNNKINRKILLFAGGGTNSATEYYSAYTLSKIFLIKYVELLNFEESKINIAILGPGWVNTKIHKPTLQKNIKNKKKTLKIINRNDKNKFVKISNCVDWIFKNIKILSGRNLSLDYDLWGKKKLLIKLKSNNNLYKLRRFGNDIYAKKN